MKRVLIAAAGAVGVLCASVTATAQTVGRAQSFAIVGGSGIAANGAVSTILLASAGVTAMRKRSA